MATTRTVFIAVKGQPGGGAQVLNQTQQQARQVRDSFEQIDEAAVRNVRDLRDMGAVGGSAMRGILQEAESLLRRVPLIGNVLADTLGGAFRKIESQAKSSFTEVQRAEKNMLAIIQRTLDRQAGPGNVAPRATRDHVRQFADAWRSLPDDEARSGFLDAFGKDASKAATSLTTLTAASGTAATGVTGFLTALGPVGVVIVGVVAEIALLTAGLGLLALGAYKAGEAAFEITKPYIEAGKEIHELSETFNLSAVSVSSLGAATERAGLKTADATQLLRQYTEATTKAALGDGKLRQSLTALGIDWVKSIEDPDRALSEFITNYNRLPDSVEKNAAMFAVFHERARDVDRILRQTGGDFEEFKRQMQAAGIAMGDEGAEQAARMSKELTVLQQQWDATGRIAAEVFAPYIESALLLVSGYLEANREAFQAWGVGIAATIQGAIDGMQALILLLTEGGFAFGNFVAQVYNRQPGLAATGHQQNLLPLTAIARGASSEGTRVRRGGGGGGGRPDTMGLANREAALDLKDAERLYRQLTEAIKENFDQRQIDMKQYVDQMIAEETRLKDRQLEITYAKMAAAEKITDAGKRDIEMRTLNEATMSITEGFDKKVTEIRDAARKKNISETIAENNLSVELLKENGRVRLAEISANLERGLILRREAAQQALAIEMRDMDFQKLQLETQLSLQKGNREAEDEINRRLQLLAGQRAVAERLGLIKIDAAGREDDAAAAAIRSQGRSAFEAMRDQLTGVLDRNVKLSQVQALNLELQKKAYDNLLPAEREQLRMLAELADAQAAYENSFRGKLDAFFKSIPSYKDALTDSLIGGFNRIGDALAGALTNWENGFRGFFSGIASAFKSMAMQILAEMVKLSVVKGLARLFGMGGGAGAAGGGGWGGFAGGGATGGLGNLGGGGGLFGGILGGLFGLGAASAGFGSTGTAFMGAKAAAMGGGAAGGGSLIGSMGALFTNPWTAVVAGGIIGGVLLFRHFSNRTEKKLRDAIKTTYGVDIKDMQVLKQIKEIGESVYGKGQVSKHINDVIKLDAARELILNYAEMTGQDAKGLTTERMLKDPAYEGNRFVSPGGPSPVLPSVAGVGSHGSGAGGSTGRWFSPAAIANAAVADGLARLNSFLEQIKVVPYSGVVAMGAGGAAVAIANANATGQELSYPARKRATTKGGY